MPLLLRIICRIYQPLQKDTINNITLRCEYTTQKIVHKL